MQMASHNSSLISMPNDVKISSIPVGVQQKIIRLPLKDLLIERVKEQLWSIKDFFYKHTGSHFASTAIPTLIGVSILAAIAGIIFGVVKFIENKIEKNRLERKNLISENEKLKEEIEFQQEQVNKLTIRWLNLNENGATDVDKIVKLHKNNQEITERYNKLDEENTKLSNKLQEWCIKYENLKQEQKNERIIFDQSLQEKEYDIQLLIYDNQFLKNQSCGEDSTFAPRQKLTPNTVAEKEANRMGNSTESLLRVSRQLSYSSNENNEEKIEVKLSKSFNNSSSIEPHTPSSFFTEQIDETRRNDIYGDTSVQSSRTDPPINHIIGRYGLYAPPI